MKYATLIPLALLLAAAAPAGAADYGDLGTGSTSAQSGTAPGSASSPSLPTQGGATGNDTAASGGSTGSPVDFRNLDRNVDGRISRDEAVSSPGLSSRFDLLDTDRDGQISSYEWLGPSPSPATGAAGVSGESRENPGR